MIHFLNKFSILKKAQDKFDKLDNKKILLIALICILLVYTDFRLIMRMQFAGLGKITPKIIKLKKDINNLAKDLEKMQELKNRQTSQKEVSGSLMSKEIVSEDKVPLLLQAIADTANKNKVKITQMNTATDTKRQEEIIAGEKVLPVMLKLDLSTAYHSLGGFINGLQKERQFLEVLDMKIVRNPNDYFLQNVNLTLKTYVKR